MIRYLERFEERCPSEFFKGGERCSQLGINVVVKDFGRRNQACKLAELALTTVDNNRKRHEIVEKFMLINDAATVACEIPIWLWEKNLDVGISGHIDLLQIRRGKIYILDFKPGAHREKRTSNQPQRPGTLKNHSLQK